MLNEYEYEIIKSSIDDEFDLTTYLYESCDSTHKIGKEIPEVDLKDKSIIAIRANYQTSGIGQRSNVWSSPQGNLYMTLIFKVPMSYNISLVPQTAALSVKQTLEQYTNIPVKIKWINDIYCQDKKISGVLVNSSTLNENEIKLIVSAGVNLNVNPLKDSICLKNLIEKDVDVSKFSNELVKIFIQNINTLIFKNESEQILHQIDNCLLYKNEEVDIWDEKFENILKTGKFVRINEFGNAVLSTTNGELINITEGRMRLKPNNHLIMKTKFSKYFIYGSLITLTGVFFFMFRSIISKKPNY